MERHRMDPVSLVFGIAFVAAGSTFLLVDVDFADVRGETLWPIFSVFCGLLVLLIALSRTRARDDRSITPEPSQRAASHSPADGEGDVDTWPELRREPDGTERLDG